MTTRRSKPAFAFRTGCLQISGDWPGVFIRGDDALSFADTIEALYLAANERAERGIPHAEVLRWQRMEELMNILRSCKPPTMPPPSLPTDERGRGGGQG